MICNISEAQRMLFVGNSLTYSNDMPKIFEKISNDFGVSANGTSLCFPNYGLIDHWDQKTVQGIMAREHFDYVVVQQGPSSQPPGRKMLVDYNAKIKSLCLENDSNLAFFMVWPSKKYYHTFDGVILSHQYAAKENHALLFPVGQVWQNYEKKKNKENLYSEDGFHPSKAGSFLAALTIFHCLHPEKGISDMKFSKYKKWIKDKDSFESIKKLISEYEN